MQCVILAAGRGTRLRPLTNSIPKPLVKVCGQPLIDHIVSALPPVITELIIVTHYLEDLIKAHCGAVFCGRPVTYVHQDSPSGSGAALLCAAPHITEKFLFMYADDIHGAAALKRVCEEEHAILAMTTDTPELFGMLDLHPDGTLRSIAEKPAPEEAPSNLANISGWVVTPTILHYEATPSVRGEIESTDLMTAYAADYPVQVIKQDLWLPVGNHEQLQFAEEYLHNQRTNSLWVG